MSKYNKSNAPYYDNYDNYEKGKKYTHLLAVPGRVAQARELTQIQSVVKDIIKNIGDSVWKNGDVIEGCQVIIDKANYIIKVSGGRVYLDGMVHDVNETIIDIKKDLGYQDWSSVNTIGFVLNERLITDADDDLLKDPALGFDNYNQAGCHRIQSEVVIVVNDSTSAILNTLVDGEITVENYAPEYDVMTQTLARRTHDESGSYIVEGLNVRVEERDEQNFNVVVESGKAYVLGYELKIPAARRISMPRATTHSTVSRYEETYYTPYSSYTISDRGPYVSSITSVKGYKDKIEVLAAPASNTSETALSEIYVYTESGGSGEYRYSIEGYTAGVDYILFRRDNTSYIRWLGTSKYPTSSYSLTYRYTHTFIEGVDYVLYHNEQTDTHDIRWISTSTPIDGTTFEVEYEQYLARKDTVYIDHYGNISVIPGVPAQYGYEMPPEAPLNTLALATIMSPPGGFATGNASVKIRVSNIGLTRFTMNDIQRLLNRIKTVEYDQAILSLNDIAKDHSTTNNKKGILTDPLIDYSRIDYTYNEIRDSEGNRHAFNEELPIYKSTIDLLNNLCYLPRKTHTYDLPYVLDTNTTEIHDRVATLKITGEESVLSQMSATSVFRINPYSVFPQLPEITITPAVDSWIDDKIIVEPKSKDGGTQYITSSETSQETSTWRSGQSSRTEDTPAGYRVETSMEESILEQETIRYIRSKEITVHGSNFPPVEADIEILFDGQIMKLDSSADTKHNSDGKFTAKFTIPEGKILTGTREVRVISKAGYPEAESTASALYVATGLRRTIQRTVTTVTTVLINRVTTTTTYNYIDPIGQTFVLNHMTMLSSIDVYFSEKSDTAPVSCDIREVINGSITHTTYGTVTLMPSDVNIPEEGEALGSVPTKFKFSHPILLEADKEYAFVLRSTSDKYMVWVSELGKDDIISRTPVLRNPYLTGLMLSSANNSSWTMHQSTDIKFQLFEYKYEKNSSIEFSTEGIEDFSQIYLLAESLTPDGTTIDWEYDAGDGYRSISPYASTSLPSIKSSIKIRASMKNNSEFNLSPVIALDSVGAVLSSYQKEGWYISEKVRNLDEYDEVDIILDTQIPSGTELRVYVSPHDDSLADTLIEATTPDDYVARTMNYGWKEMLYHVKLPAIHHDCRIYIKMVSSHSGEITPITPAFRRMRAIMS